MGKTSDKGGGIIIMDSSHYDNKIMELFNNQRNKNEGQ